MEINSNLNAMRLQEVKLNDSAKDIANPKNYVNNSDSKSQEVTPDLIEAITAQIPIPIAYEANGTSIKVQDEVFASLLNIKA
ncbi:MAG: hypothetical protein C0626_01925 [Arcobacter sp.]|uniref:hypothetical protein n=1 Tax=uncultured Arcobacter sp. TaxID=165434 RepID=UPI000CC05D33|nr:hypothetical protein [uncultured Arcobacter sp.]PLY11349.1 MAG: hypothetical protein C0626_01925 [Arcobacter sp.]